MCIFIQVLRLPGGFVHTEHFWDSIITLGFMILYLVIVHKVRENIEIECAKTGYNGANQI